jgi:hypothetical protein
MRTSSSPYGPPPHPNGQASRQLGPLATVAVSFAIAVGLIAASGIIALALPIGG